MSEKLKTPEEIAEREVNKKLGSAIADRKLKIREHQAKIKKLEKEIDKIKKGELVPDTDEDSSKKECIKIIEKKEEHHYHYPEEKRNDWNRGPYTWTTTSDNTNFRNMEITASTTC